MADLVWSDPDPEKEDFAISPRFVLVMDLNSRLCLTFPAVAQDIPLALGLFTNFWKRMACRTFSARISYAWKATRLSLTNIYLQCGRRQIIVIGAEIRRVYWKLDLEMICILMYSKRPQKTREMDRVIKQRRMLVGKYVTCRCYLVLYSPTCILCSCQSIFYRLLYVFIGEYTYNIEA